MSLLFSGLFVVLTMYSRLFYLSNTCPTGKKVVGLQHLRAPAHESTGLWIVQHCITGYAADCAITNIIMHISVLLKSCPSPLMKPLFAAGHVAHRGILAVHNGMLLESHPGRLVKAPFAKKSLCIAELCLQDQWLCQYFNKCGQQILTTSPGHSLKVRRRQKGTGCQ